MLEVCCAKTSGHSSLHVEIFQLVSISLGTSTTMMAIGSSGNIKYTFCTSILLHFSLIFFLYNFKGRQYILYQ